MHSEVMGKAPKLSKGEWPALPVRTPRLVLRLVALGDADEITRACSHPSTRWGIHVLPSPYHRRDAVGFVRKKRAQFRRRESLALAIDRRNAGGPEGVIELNLSTGDRRAGLGYWVAPGYRGKGYATEAARAMCRIGFDRLRLHRIEAWVLARNRASMRVLEKAGFRKEGRLRHRFKVGGRWLDQVWMGRLKRR